jgi:hypothetical protein
MERDCQAVRQPHGVHTRTGTPSGPPEPDTACPVSTNIYQYEDCFEAGRGADATPPGAAYEDSAT